MLRSGAPRKPHIKRRLHHHRLAAVAAKEWGIFNANNLDMEVILMQSALVPAALTQGDIDYQAGVGPASVNATMAVSPPAPSGFPPTGSPTGSWPSRNTKLSKA